ncbi:MAG: Uma2 family endonuclease [bacterium]|nr:Uma2 family endonuclease [bacterium]
MTVLQSTRRSSWTYADYLQLEDSPRYEVLNGELHSMPAPDLAHQRVVRNASVALWDFVRDGRHGEVLWSPIDVILDQKQTTVLQPDVVYVAADRAKRLLRRLGVFGAPDLVIEVLSPATTERDRVQKKALYKAARVAEYWLLDPTRERGEVHCLEPSGEPVDFTLTGSADVGSAGRTLLQSRVLPEWTLDLAAVFRE